MESRAIISHAVLASYTADAALEAEGIRKVRQHVSEHTAGTTKLSSLAVDLGIERVAAPTVG